MQRRLELTQQARRKYPVSPKVAKKATKASIVDNTPKLVATVTKVPIPTRKRTLDINGPLNKKARVEGLDYFTLLAAQKEKEVVILNKNIDLHIPCWLLKSQSIQDPYNAVA